MTSRFGVFFSALFCLAIAATAQAQPAAVPDGPVARASLAIEQGQYGDALRELASPDLDDFAEAQFLLADLHARGLGVPQNFNTAIEYYRRASSLGSPAAENALGRAYAEGHAIEPDSQLALEYLLAAARSGDARYQSDLARALETGLDGEPQLAEAASWYQRAADQGHLDSITSLGVMYLEERGVERDAGWAIELFGLAAAAGDPRAQNNLGLIYVRGEDVERDYDRAFELFSAAAERGQREAMTNLSVMYASGFGVAVDEAESVRLLEQARRARGLTLSSVLAQVGFPYDSRLAEPDWNLPLDPAEEQAAGAGDPVALYQTALRYLNGAGVRRDVPAGIERMEHAAEAGMGTAQLMLALMYAHGRNLPQDYEHAYVWASRAALAAVPAAADVRDALASEMSAAQLRRAQQRVVEALDRAE